MAKEKTVYSYFLQEFDNGRSEITTPEYVFFKKEDAINHLVDVIFVERFIVSDDMSNEEVHDEQEDIKLQLKDTDSFDDVGFSAHIFTSSLEEQ